MTTTASAMPDSETEFITLCPNLPHRLVQHRREQRQLANQAIPVTKRQGVRILQPAFKQPIAVYDRSVARGQRNSIISRLFLQHQNQLLKQQEENERIRKDKEAQNEKEKEKDSEESYAHANLSEHALISLNVGAQSAKELDNKTGPAIDLQLPSISEGLDQVVERQRQERLSVFGRKDTAHADGASENIKVGSPLSTLRIIFTCISAIIHIICIQCPVHIFTLTRPPRWSVVCGLSTSTSEKWMVNWVAYNSVTSRW